jgi:hypothetical protein
MSKADDLAQWLVSNKDKKGSPEWEAKAAEYRREADAESTKVSPQVQQQRDVERIKTLQEEFLKETDKLKQGAPGALDNLKAISAEIVAAGGKAPPIPAPPSRADEFKEMAGQALQGTIQGAGEIAREVGPGASLGTAGLLAGILEARGKGPAALIEKGAQGAVQGATRAAPAAARPAAPPVAPPVTPPVAPSAPSILSSSGAPISPTEQQATRILQGTTGDLGTTGRARMSGFNIETSQQAARAKQAEQVAEQLRRAGLVSQGASEFFAAQPGGTSTPSGVWTPRSSTMPPPAPPAKPAGALEEVTKLFRKMAETGTRASSAVGGVARALPVLSYPLAGYSIGEDFGAVEKELAKERPDYADIALRGLGALGTGLSLHPVTAPVGLPLAIGSPLVAASRRKMMADPNKPKMTQEEMEQALPTFAPFP